MTRWHLISALALAAVALSGLAASAGPPGDLGVDPPGQDDDVDPGGGDARDVDPAPGDDRPLPDSVDLEGEDENAPDGLPPEGMAERPAFPRIGVDVLYPGHGVVGQGQAVISLNNAGEDTYLFLNIGAVFVGKGWAMGPRIPLRIRLIDHAPRTASVIRKEDWDELSDFARILAFVQLGHVGEPYFLRFGELNGVNLGHGSIVNRYYNTIDIDHYQGGLYAAFDPGLVGGELLLDNVFDPDILGARFFLRPMNGAKRLPYVARKLKIGFTMGADLQAPTKVATNSQGEILTDEDFDPIIERTDALTFFGFDLELPLVSTRHVDWVPYLDLNALDTSGAGVHVGSFLNVRFDRLREWRTRVEYRYSGQDYEPDYVNAFYEVHRVRFRRDPKTQARQTKLSWLRNSAARKARSGVYAETEFRWINMMRYTFVYANDQGPDNTDLMMKLRFPRLGPVRLSFFFARLDFDGFNDFFDTQDTVLAASIRYNIAERFYVRLRVVNEWWLEHTETGSSEYRTATDYDFGFGLIINL